MRAPSAACLCSTALLWRKLDGSSWYNYSCKQLQDCVATRALYRRQSLESFRTPCTDKDGHMQTPIDLQSYVDGRQSKAQRLQKH